MQNTKRVTFIVTVCWSTEDLMHLNQLILNTLFTRPLSETRKLWENRKSSRKLHWLPFSYFIKKKVKQM